MARQSKYIKLEDLEVYRLSRELSKSAWEMYDTLHWQNKKTIGDQFIRSSDSVGANIAEGYSRYHYLDRIQFFYNSRASLAEAIHWSALLLERKMISDEDSKKFLSIGKSLSIKLQNFIKSIYSTKAKQ